MRSPVQPRATLTEPLIPFIPYAASLDRAHARLKNVKRSRLAVKTERLSAAEAPRAVREWITGAPRARTLVVEEVVPDAQH